MNVKTFLILKTDSTSWVLTFDVESKKRTIYEFNSWILDKEPIPAVEPAEAWLEHEGAVIEAAFPIDTEKRTIAFVESEMLEYTELLEDVALY